MAGLLGVLPSTMELEIASEPEPEPEPEPVTDATSASAIGESADAGLHRKSVSPGDVLRSLGDTRTLQS